MSDLLPLDLPEPLPSARCWYCGASEGPWELEHQLPRSRGGAGGANVVGSCERCNHLKGKLTLDEFREALGLRLSIDEVVFYGESGPGRPHTAITSVRSLGANREVIRLDPLVGDRLRRGVLYLRRRGRPMLTRKDAASEAIGLWLDDLADELLDGEDFPEPGGQTTLFSGSAPVPIIRPGEASRTPRVVFGADVTKVDAELLEDARRALRVLRTHENPNLTLTQLVSEALSRLLEAIEVRYPELAELRSGR